MFFSINIMNNEIQILLIETIIIKNIVDNISKKKHLIITPAKHIKRKFIAHKKLLKTIF